MKSTDVKHLPFQFASQLTTAYQRMGELALVLALIHELRERRQTPDPRSAELPIEDPSAPSWLTGGDAERIFDSWLVRERLPAAAADQEAMMTLARVPQRFIAMEENGQYIGMVNIDAFVRQLVLQPARKT